MKYLSLTLLLILLPVSLFPEKEIRSDFKDTTQFQYQNCDSKTIPLGFETANTDFIYFRLETLNGVSLFSANLGIVKAGYSTFNLPLLDNQSSGFYRVLFITPDNILSDRIVYLPGLNI